LYYTIFLMACNILFFSLGLLTRRGRWRKNSYY